MIDPHVLEELGEQYRALLERVAYSGMYGHEVPEFALACSAYTALASSRMGILDDLGSLTTSESRNVVRQVRLQDGSLAVAKFVGNSREPGEGEVLATWRQFGLPCVEPLLWGYEAVETDDSSHKVAYLLTRFLEGSRIPAAQTEHDRAALVVRLLDLVAPFHRCEATPSVARRWAERMGLHLRWTLPLTQQAQLRLPDRWEEKLNELSTRGNVLVHGDPAGNNILETGDGRLVLLDPPGALLALREADVAQICSQVGGFEHVDALIEVACSHDPTLDQAAASALAGVNFLAWAGYFLADHPNPDATGATGDGVEAARRYVDRARQLLDRFQSG